MEVVGAIFSDQLDLRAAAAAESGIGAADDGANFLDGIKGARSTVEESLADGFVVNVQPVQGDIGSISARASY